MLLQVIGFVQRVEFGEDSRAALFQESKSLLGDRPGPQPDRVDPVVVQAAPALEDLDRNPAVDRADRDVGAILGSRAGQESKLRSENQQSLCHVEPQARSLDAALPLAAAR